MGPEIVARAKAWSDRVSIADDGQEYTYAHLLHASEERARRLLRQRGTSTARSAAGTRTVFLVPPGFDHAAWQWAAWRAGSVAVPLSASQAPAEWEYIVRDVEPAFVVGPDEPGTLADISARHGSVFVRSRDDPARDRASDAAGGAEDVRLPAVESGSAALVLYTSGTTSRPKGVVLTHANLAAQMSALAGAWGWRPDDRVLHVLPLNHVHGIVNVLGCALWSGACCEFLPFEANAVWERFAAGGPTLFMAVPTVYTKLLAAFEAAPPATRVRWSAGAGRLRLMVSGSAALPVTLLARWREATGHVLLERYGMTEIGMALSNPLDGPRRAGSVGTPLPGVEVRLVDEHGKAVPDGGAGEIEVRGPAVFREYWRRPDATREAFRDGWFRTGDVARVEDGAYRILGRSSVDIIKTGGYKVSALEVEEVLREHPGVADAAVVGVPDEEWGERVAAAIVPREGAAVALGDLRDWAAPRLAKYKLPTLIRVVASLPRNAMGKVVKTEVRRMFQDP